MGIALANAAVQAGAKVTLIAGQVTVPLPQTPAIEVVRVTTTEDLYTSLKERFSQADILIMAAAVADYRPVETVGHKIKKKDGAPHLTITLTETIDILKNIAKMKHGQYVVGFAAETNDPLENVTKLASKNADMIIANSVAGDAGAFGSDQNQVTILQKNQTPIKLVRQSKAKIANEIIELVSAKLKSGD